MAERYEPGAFEAGWRERWADADLFRTREREGAPKFYGMDFFPYPSGAGLSVGHCRNYVPTDAICRMKVMQGFSVLHPMGFDAFGLPAENEAIKRGTHPAPMIEAYAANYKRQMDLVGISYDWHRSFKSSDPSYYRWTQWIFGLLYKRGLAYRTESAVNWDPVDKTVLADEEVVGGRAERSGALVEKKFIPQWKFRITDYAQRLLDDLDGIDWPEGIKAQQRNWIGRSEGVEFQLAVSGERLAEPEPYDLEVATAHRPPLTADTFAVFTTRIDTIFGMTFCVLAPEHPLVDSLPGTDEERAAVRAYRESAAAMSDIDRTSDEREKTGVFTGAYAINPANGARVPIYVADYVLATYGTGAIMAVPAHDERDFAFARKYGMEVTRVIAPGSGDAECELPFVAKDGVLVNSGEYDGMAVAEAQAALGTWIEALGIGQRKIQYRLRDWLISRQRYWGCPIPMIHRADGEMELVPDAQLPVELPVVDSYEPSGDGTSPLAHIQEFVNCTDSQGRLARRETDTMGGFACSAWYFLRFLDPDNYERAFEPALAEQWMPVDCYVGGAEHAVMHLLYARFWTKVLQDEGYLKIGEPFQRLMNQGQVLALTPYRAPREGERLDTGSDGVLVSFEEARALPENDLNWRWARMSKSKGNVVTPDEMVETYGADALRLFLLFKAPFSADIQWENKGVEDTARFLSRVFRLVDGLSAGYSPLWSLEIESTALSQTAVAVRRLTHQTITDVTRDIDAFGFNTYVSWLMKYLNGLTDLLKDRRPEDEPAWSEATETMILLLSPGAPHSADELWSSLGREGFTYDAAWPVARPELAKADTVTIVVQVNGKLRDSFEAPADAVQSALADMALALEKVAPYLEGKTIRKTIVVPGKLVNLVVG